MIIVGYVYGYNGMASWCIELARVIHNSGREVLLIVSPSIADRYVDVPIFVYPSHISHERGLFKKVIDKLRKYVQLLPLVPTRQDWIADLDSLLRKSGVKPKAYLLNQSNLFNVKVSVPQYVAAWADPPFFKDYLNRIFQLNSGSRNLLDELYNALYWYKSDWSAYHNATAVLPVSKLLGDKLKKQDCQVHVLHPPFVKRNKAAQSFSHVGTEFRPLRIAMMSLYIDDPRKGYSRVVDIIEKWPNKKYVEFILIGGASDSFIQRLSAAQIPFVSHGVLPREEAIGLLASSDLFLFASVLDDWGFVQVEAMSMGIPVLSPDIPLFREIVGNEQFLYHLADNQDLINKLDSILHDRNILINAQGYFQYRYETRYSAEKCISTLELIGVFE